METIKLYVGSREYCPKGYKTLDIDSRYNPDYVADIVDLSIFEDETVDAVCANAVLEHISWPDSFLAISELTRILKVNGKLSLSVPDLGVLCKLIYEGKTSWYPTALLYGVGGRDNEFEMHRFGWTKEMMMEMLKFFGYSHFSYFNSDVSDSSMAWLYSSEGEKIGASLNIECIKTEKPLVNPRNVYELLCKNPMMSFTQAVGRCMSDASEININILSENEEFSQSLAFEIIDAKQRIKYLEGLMNGNLKRKFPFFRKKR